MDTYSVNQFYYQIPDNTSPLSDKQITAKSLIFCPATSLHQSELKSFLDKVLQAIPSDKIGEKYIIECGIDQVFRFSDFSDQVEFVIAFNMQSHQFSLNGFEEQFKIYQFNNIKLLFLPDLSVFPGQALRAHLWENLQIMYGMK